jgi:hypothetical protein
MFEETILRGASAGHLGDRFDETSAGAGDMVERPFERGACHALSRCRLST